MLTQTGKEPKSSDRVMPQPPEGETILAGAIRRLQEQVSTTYNLVNQLDSSARTVAAMPPTEADPESAINTDLPAVTLDQFLYREINSLSRSNDKLYAVVQHLLNTI